MLLLLNQIDSPSQSPNGSFAQLTAKLLLSSKKIFENNFNYEVQSFSLVLKTKNVKVEKAAY